MVVKPPKMLPKNQTVKSVKVKKSGTMLQNTNQRILIGFLVKFFLLAALASAPPQSPCVIKSIPSSENLTN